MQPDELRYLTSETLEDCTVYNYETGKPGAVYDMEKGAGNDPYELFLSGSISSSLSIENPNAETDRELIVFRDSFGSSLAPLLAEGYAKITLADIRYLHHRPRWASCWTSPTRTYCSSTACRCSTTAIR